LENGHAMFGVNDAERIYLEKNGNGGKLMTHGNDVMGVERVNNKGQ